MDWTAAIEKHREALKGIVAALVAMAAGAGLGSHGCGDAPPSSWCEPKATPRQDAAAPSPPRRAQAAASR